MKLEDQVVSLELAKRLKELGVKQSSLFWHGTNWEGKAMIGYVSLPSPEKYVMENACSAFTVAELLEMMPAKLTEPARLWIGIENPDCDLPRYFSTCDGAEYPEDWDARGDNMANVLAEMLIHLIENKLIEAK